MRASRDATLALTLVLACGVALSAHRRDEYLQAARIAVAPGRVDIALDLTPGIAVADGVIAEIDRDSDGTASAGEQQAYVRRVQRALAVGVDGDPRPLEIQAARFPELDSFRRGEGSIRLLLSATLPSLVEGTHHIVFRNAHHADGSVYLANALVPETDRVAITGQRRDSAQRELTIDYVLQASPAFMGPQRDRLAVLGGGLTALMLLPWVWKRRERAFAPTADAHNSTTLPTRLRALRSK